MEEHKSEVRSEKFLAKANRSKAAVREETNKKRLYEKPDIGVYCEEGKDFWCD